MFKPNYTITNQILKHIGQIDASKEIVEATPIIPAWENKLKKDALERAIHFGTRLDGNNLTLEQVQELLDGKEINASRADIQDLLSYQQGFEFTSKIVKQIGPGKPYNLTIETISEIHRLITENVLPAEHSGIYRERQIVIRNTQTGEISYSPPPAVEVSFMLEDLVSWVNSKDGRNFHPVIKSAVIHFEIMRIHPFLGANSKTAQLLNRMVLALDDYYFHDFMTLNEYFDQDPVKYFSLIQKVARQKVVDSSDRDITEWLEYFVEGFAEEVLSIREKVKLVSRESHIKDKFGFGIELNERQMIILEYLRRHGSMMNKDFRKIFPDFSDDTVLRELKFLKEKGLVKKVGGTKKAQYMLG
jgi:Fic family protein